MFIHPFSSALFLFGGLNALSYPGKSGSSYGNQRRGWRIFGKGRGKPKKNDENVIYVRDEDRPKVPPEIDWQERVVPPGVRVILDKPEGLTTRPVKFLLSNDLDKQLELAFQISKVASTGQKLNIKVLLPDRSVKKFKIIKTELQQPSDKPVSFQDLQFVGNLKNKLRQNGFTIIGD